MEDGLSGVEACGVKGFWGGVRDGEVEKMAGFGVGV